MWEALQNGVTTAGVMRRLDKKNSTGGEATPRVQFPWFILLFVLAALANTYLPVMPSATKTFFHLGRLGLTATLFLIGSGISRSTLEEVGWRPLLLGVLLWLGVGLTSLYFIRTGAISL